MTCCHCLKVETCFWGVEERKDEPQSSKRKRNKIVKEKISGLAVNVNGYEGVGAAVQVDESQVGSLRKKGSFIVDQCVLEQLQA